jgi:hypothetical protein
MLHKKEIIMKKLIITAMTIIVGTYALAGEIHDTKGYKYTKVPNGLVITRTEDNYKVLVNYTPFGAETVSQEGVHTYYYNETGVIYNLTDNTSTNSIPHAVEYFKKKG